MDVTGGMDELSYYVIQRKIKFDEHGVPEIGPNGSEEDLARVMELIVSTYGVLGELFTAEPTEITEEEQQYISFIRSSTLRGVDRFTDWELVSLRRELRHDYEQRLGLGVVNAQSFEPRYSDSAPKSIEQLPPDIPQFDADEQRELAAEILRVEIPGTELPDATVAGFWSGLHELRAAARAAVALTDEELQFSQLSDSEASIFMFRSRIIQELSDETSEYA